MWLGAIAKRVYLQQRGYVMRVCVCQQIDACVYVHNKGVLSAARLRVVVNLCGHRQRALASEAKGPNGDSKAVCLYVANRRVVDKGCVEVRCISGHRPTECAYDSR